MEDYQEEYTQIYEPLEEYKRQYREVHERNAKEYVESLIEKSQVDRAANKTLVNEIKKLQAEHASLSKQRGKFAFLQGLMIFLIVAGVGSVIAAFVMANDGSGFGTTNLIMAISGAVAAVLSLVLILTTISPKLKHFTKLVSEAAQKIAAKQKLGYQQMAPLNELFTEGMSQMLFQKSIPLIKLDRMFDSRRLDYLVSKFGLGAARDVNRSTLYVQSGEINGNPFYISRDMIHRLGTKTYTGSITISWTTTAVVNGQRVTQYHTQVLSASLDKPCPYYHEQPYLVYGNEAAPDLIFSRQDSDAEKMTDKQIERKVDRDIKKLNRQSEKSIAKGQNYTVMGNAEFEVLFHAVNRNNETQFRLLFTPLAQRQLLALMKDKEIGFGDDFDFVKYKMINTVIPEQLSRINLDVKPSYFHDYDLEAIINRFVAYQVAYFRHVYFALAPLLAIPLYQQQKPHEYIYKDLYDSYVSFYEHERVANSMGDGYFKNPASATTNILKTNIVKSAEGKDVVRVTAYGYRTVARTDYISKVGGDGRWHQIPVHWTEYIPVDKDTDIEIKVLEEKPDKTYADQARDFVEALRNRQVDPATLFMMGSFITRVLK